MTRTAHRARRPPNELIGRTPRAVPLPHAPLERGSVTAEFATVLPAVMVVALLLLSLARLVGCPLAARMRHRPRHVPPSPLAAVRMRLWRRAMRSVTASP